MKKKIIKFRKRRDIPKLDFETNLFLSFVKAKKVSHPSVREINSKLHMYPRACDKQEVYVFNDFEEYRNFYLMYLKSIEDELIEKAILTHGNKGQIVALKGLVNSIIVRKQVLAFFDNLTDEVCDQIYEEGYFTPYDVLAYWEENNVCPEATFGILDKNRCDFFDSCSSCRCECATHHMKYEVPNTEELKKVRARRNKENTIVW